MGSTRSVPRRGYHVPMTIFVYEQITAALDAGHSLYREGLAMREAVIDDFRRLGVGGHHP